MRRKIWMALAGCVILGLSGCGSTASEAKADLSNWEEGVESISFGEVITNEDQEFFGDTFL